MDSIFSDDEEFDALREQLFDGAIEDESKTMVSLFGMYALQTSNEQKPRKDLFLRGLEAPTNDLDPYRAESFQHNEVPVVKKSVLGGNFSFFGMKQGRLRVEEKKTTTSDLIAERNMMLKKLNDLKAVKDVYSDTENSSDDENIDPTVPERKSIQIRETNLSTRELRKEVRKRKRVVEISSSEESDSDSNEHPPSSRRSPRRKRVSPA